MLVAKRRGQPRHHGERGRDRRDADAAGKAVARRAHLLAHGARVADDAPRPSEHLLAFRRQPLEARAALTSMTPSVSSSCLIAGRQRRLRHAAFLGRPAEMLLLGERDEEFELVDHGPTLPAVPRRATGSRRNRFLSRLSAHPQVSERDRFPNVGFERYVLIVLSAKGWLPCLVGFVRYCPARTSSSIFSRSIRAFSSPARGIAEAPRRRRRP